MFSLLTFDQLPDRLVSGVGVDWLKIGFEIFIIYLITLGATVKSKITLVTLVVAILFVKVTREMAVKLDYICFLGYPFVH